MDFNFGWAFDACPVRMSSQRAWSTIQKLPVMQRMCTGEQEYVHVSDLDHDQ